MAACSLETTNSLHPTQIKPTSRTSFVDSLSPAIKTAADSSRALSKSSRPDPQVATIYELLQGRWQYTQDARYVLAVRGHRYQDYYNGRLVDSTTFVLTQECPSDSSAELADNNGRYLVQPRRALCWQVIEVDTQHLLLRYSLEGNTLSFTRLR